MKTLAYINIFIFTFMYFFGSMWNLAVDIRITGFILTIFPVVLAIGVLRGHR
jgi:hypothetical protein